MGAQGKHRASANERRNIAVTPEQIRIVQSTWVRMLLVRETTAQLFYARLFEVDPGLRNLFRGDLREQGYKLIQVMDAAVNGLNRLEHLVPIVQQLGRRHVGYGVKDHHYGTVGAVLLWTLNQGLGPDFTEEVRAAWTAAYDVLASTMRAAATAMQPR
jgi:hemoglobin-like flavoprotein